MEFVMVIVIMGILITLAIPRFKVYYEMKLHTASGILVSDIRYVQSVAISRHTDTKIDFDSTKNRYQAYYYNDDAGSWQAIKDPLTRRDLIRDFNVDSQYRGIDISNVDINNTSTLRFNWWGTPQDGNGNDITADASVSLSYKGDNTTVKITPQTAHVSIE